MPPAKEKKTSRRQPAATARQSAYSAPALEKGLDVLELLTGIPEGP